LNLWFWFFVSLPFMRFTCKVCLSGSILNWVSGLLLDSFQFWYVLAFLTLDWSIKWSLFGSFSACRGGLNYNFCWSISQFFCIFHLLPLSFITCIVMQSCSGSWWTQALSIWYWLDVMDLLLLVCNEMVCALFFNLNCWQLRLVQN
jgi:hypothetical protein